MKGGETSAVINGWLIVEVQVLGEVEEAVDALLLGEDAVRLVRGAFFVPPASFFGAAVLLTDVVELDGFWGTTIKLFCPVVLVDPVSCCAGTGIALDVLLED